MKTILNLLSLILLFSLINQVSFAQNEQKTSVLSDQTKVVYAMNDAKKLEGVYSVVKDNDQVFLRGVYKDNARSGNWYAFNDNGNVFLRYNYDLKKLLYLDTVSINRLKVEVKTDDPEIKEKASIPVPISSIDQYISLLGTELKRMILKENKSADGSLDVDLITNIDKNGKANYMAAYVVDGIPVTKRLIIAEKAFDIDWIPSTYRGTNYASVFSVRAKIDFAQKPGIKQRFIWVY
ncbi:hypothetical protein ASE74_10220 [Pedobacter sp. Leaf216]|uniref:hypothetical protein n=1 Tax=Pedobacter sp. Leaf216 TaxID=1735684 RepID=UPI0006F47D84|nr:hypothetical protein [Pedobacter sp. Leaf216]KQM65233.1 hypothetical protein ASE74_10220 [Pedobacter sp. Leaf216]